MVMKYCSRRRNCAVKSTANTASRLVMTMTWTRLWLSSIVKGTERSSTTRLSKDRNRKNCRTRGLSTTHGQLGARTLLGISPDSVTPSATRSDKVGIHAVHRIAKLLVYFFRSHTFTYHTPSHHRCKRLPQPRDRRGWSGKTHLRSLCSGVSMVAETTNPARFGDSRCRSSPWLITAPPIYHTYPPR